MGVEATLRPPSELKPIGAFDMARRIIRVIATIASALVAIAVLGIAAIVFILPRLTHGEALTVLTGSMQPTIPPGSIVFVRPVDPHNVHIGDVITFAVKSNHYGTSLVTHRVVAEKLALDPSGDYQPEFTTKGDANNAPDVDPVLARNVRGVMWFHLPHVGGIRDAMHTKGGVASIFVIVLAGYAALQLVAAHKERRSGPANPRKQAAVPSWVSAELSAAESVTVARFNATGFDGASARAVTTLLGASLVGETADTFTVILISDVSGSQEDIEMLDALDPLNIWTSAKARKGSDSAQPMHRVISKVAPNA